MFKLKPFSCQFNVDNRVAWDSLRYGRAVKTSSLAIFCRRGGWCRGTSPKFPSIPRSGPEMCKLFAGAGGGVPLFHGPPAQRRRLDHLSKNLGALFEVIISESRTVLFRDWKGSSLSWSGRLRPRERGECPRHRLAPGPQQHIRKLCFRLYFVCIFLTIILMIYLGDEDLARDLPSPRPFRLPPLVPSPPSSPPSSSGSMPPLTSSDQGDTSDDDDGEGDDSDEDYGDEDSDSEDEWASWYKIFSPLISFFCMDQIDKLKFSMCWFVSLLAAGSACWEIFLIWSHLLIAYFALWLFTE